ncbi:alpha-glucosidase [Enterococcus sp. MJM12]|uniref:Alpha-glucosidase n=1 Tax=Candidatus Enterococcus myersii TaxID=2815322 RepID=A0ABS3H9H3_9ENTE|nr:alpha-glucosidase [Enterococcus sp. MJM12]MBO0450110.1 alpha-glucosidase [Enterococcus sp. MJM12]
MTNWWQNAVGYQIYPRSFYDSNGDGIGDIKGIIAKIPYLKELGVDFIWLNPMYKSPNVDNGYDISDYKDIAAEYGDMAQFKELLEACHKENLKIILDLVVNHTSDQHPWFVEAKKGKENPYRNYYHWQNATPANLPNNWQSFFGGSTWTVDEPSGQAYFHVFAPEQPDLNWKNEAVRTEIYQMIRWWLELGIDGFRLDAISHIQKEPWNFKIKDNPWAPFMNVAGIDNYMKDLQQIFNEYNVMTVGEASGVSSKKAVNWTDSEGYLDMIFELEHNVRKGVAGSERIDLLGFKKVIARWQKDLGKKGWNALYLENHDNPRFNTILGNETKKSAKALAMMYLLLRGTPFIYQGQELGATNYPFQTISEVDAKDTLSFYHRLLAENKSEAEALQLATSWSRDHARTPMQWDDSKNAGFTTGTPWLKVNPNYVKINVAAEKEDPDSVLNFYRQLIQIRRQEETFATGTFELLAQNDPDIFAYLRKGEKQFLIITNISQKTRKLTLPKKIWQKNWQSYITNDKTAPKKLTKEMTFAPYDALLFVEQSNS